MIYCKDIDITSLICNASILKRGTGQRAGKDRRDYIDIISGFDIETTRIEKIDNSVMYIWQWSFYSLKNNSFIATIYGRTWKEYIETCEIIKRSLGLIPSKYPLYMVRLIHNLSYEFQFMSAFYEYKQQDVFALEPRKIARADSFNCIEDRCTFIHSNMSLAKYAETWHTAHQKLSGIEFDYNKKRYSWTPLSEKELAYCENDVLSMVEAYVQEMLYYEDTLYSVPLLRRGT